MEKSAKEKGTVYNEAKIYQIALFSLNNAATNLYLALMGYASYYANSIAGFSVVLISFLLTALNVFDGVTDRIPAGSCQGKARKISSVYAVGQRDHGGKHVTAVRDTGIHSETVSYHLFYRGVRIVRDRVYPSDSSRQVRAGGHHEQSGEAAAFHLL